MLQQEFETRVKMRVTPQEYAAIETVYANSEVNKDDFCRMWAKMNQSRIKAYRTQEQERERRELIRERVWKVYNKHYSSSKLLAKAWTPVDAIFSKREIEALCEAGIKVYEGERAMQLLPLMGFIRVYLKGQ